MTITKVKYEKLFPTGAYLNEKIGFEADIDGDNENEQWAIERLRELAEQSHKAKYPHLYIDNQPITIEQSEPEDNPPSKEQGLIQVIQLCNSVTALERFRPQVEALNNVQVTGSFEEKLNQLRK